jgi:replicative DNA helicase
MSRRGALGAGRRGLRRSRRHAVTDYAPDRRGGEHRSGPAGEQDADMVILLNRPDAFDRDDPRGGEADFILAKHRNGPTKTVTVAHQLHLSRFTNMAR